jgi:hypothetical protein
VLSVRLLSLQTQLFILNNADERVAAAQRVWSIGIISGRVFAAIVGIDRPLRKRRSGSKIAMRN